MLQQYTIPNFLCYWLTSMHHLKWRLWCPASEMSPDPLLVRYPLENFVPRPFVRNPSFVVPPLKTAWSMCHTSRCAWQHRETLQCRWDGLNCSYTVLPDRSDAGMIRRMHMYCICSRAWLVLICFYCSIDRLLCTCSRILELRWRVVARTYVCMCTVFAATLDQLRDV